MNRLLIVALTLSPVATACSQTDSDGVLTKAVHADLTVRAAGDGQAVASAVLRVGGSDSLNYLNLVGDDALTATVGTVTNPLSETSFLDVISYTATFDGEAEDTPAAIAFTRTIDAGAPSSTVTLPAPFTVTAGTTAARAEDFMVTFTEASGSTDPMSWKLRGTCVAAASGTIPAAAGTHTIASGMIVAAAGSEAETCPVELTIVRSRTGTLDPGYEGGRIVGEQERTIEFSSTP